MALIVFRACYNAALAASGDHVRARWRMFNLVVFSAVVSAQAPCTVTILRQLALRLHSLPSFQSLIIRVSVYACPSEFGVVQHPTMLAHAVVAADCAA
jgi:hypothetical protein